MEASYTRSLKRLRGLREAAGLTLKQLEIKSRGKWKAVVVGSYERGTRHLSLKRAVELCEFYGADISDLGSRVQDQMPRSLIIDLKRLSESRNLPDDLTGIIGRTAGRITTLRGDLNGEVLSIRSNDLEYLQLLTGLRSVELLRALEIRGLLFKR